jgi:NAD(P)-dependent dehydrogenase (short-subunit alcohol dehydrogenase family)
VTGGSGAAASVEAVGVGAVVRPRFDPIARPIESLTDDEWEAAVEAPITATIAALQRAFRDGIRRIVVVVPTTSMSGGARYAHVAAPAEAIRVLVKSAARQWGTAGVTVNAVAVSPEGMLDDPGVAGPVTIAPPALDGDDPSAVIAFLCSDAAGDVTGQTFTIDRGRWM